MNREVMKCMGTKRIPIDRLASLLQTFTLKHAAKALPDLLETADLENASNKQFLLSVLETEVIGRNERRRKRNYSAAHFPPNIHPLEEFNPEELESGISQAQIEKLKEGHMKSRIIFVLFVAKNLNTKIWKETTLFPGVRVVIQ